MSNLANLPILEELSKDREYVDTYPMETDKGTKRMKARFYEKAANERNAWIEEKLSYYRTVKKTLLDEIAKRRAALLPVDSSESYENAKTDVANLLYCVRLNADCSNAFKLNIDYILSSINDLTSLEELNQKIGTFISYFRQYGIPLDIEDFSYTMFTKMYMETFFQNPNYDSLKDTFEQVYFKCPDIKLQLKMNLHYIVNKYNDKLGEYVESLKNTSYANFEITGDPVPKYLHERQELGDRIATDEYYNTMLFLDDKKKIADYLDGSPARFKIYNSFALNGDYPACSDEDKKMFNDAMMGFYLTLNELKKFYRYEFILKELIGYYKDKDAAKSQYISKTKEIEKEEKEREKLNAQYRKAQGFGFLARKSESKQQLIMLKMNDQIRKLNEMYRELINLEIRYHVSQLNDSSTIYDLFLTALKSFAFLERCFSGENFQELSLEDDITEYLRFLYNPNNDFLRKVNGFADYNITDIVAEKYRLLNLNITSEMIKPDTIDLTLQDAQFINLIQNIGRSKISLHNISVLCQMTDILDSEK